MKVVVKYNGKSHDELNEILLFLKSEGFCDFIVFSEIDISKSCVLENDAFEYEANIVYITTKNIISTYDALSSIKGSLTNRFLVVYSTEIEKFNLRDALKYHKSTTQIATLLSTDSKTAGIFFENELFDYMTEPNHLEREVLKRIFEDTEASIYNCIVK